MTLGASAIAQYGQEWQELWDESKEMKGAY